MGVIIMLTATTLNFKQDHKAKCRISKAFCLGLMIPLGFICSANGNISSNKMDWTPSSSERLVKLPPNYLKKSVDRDFEKSGLAQALYKNQDSITLKIDTLKDIQGSISQTNDAELKTELRHQYLAEKQAYLELVAKDQNFRRKKTETTLKLYEKLLQDLNRKKNQLSPQKTKLLENQIGAQKRFNASMYEVNKKLFRSGVFEESKYTRDYAKNADAINRLVQTIKNHPSSEHYGSRQNGQSKADFVIQLIQGLEASLAILDQEKQILGYMAKVVSLDARALAEALPETQKFKKETNRPLQGLEFFLN